MDTLVRWECQKCGHINNGLVPPVECPYCGAPGEQFRQLEREPDGNIFFAEERIPRDVDRWQCDVCGHVVLSNEQPAECSSCGASKEHFQKLKYDI